MDKKAEIVARARALLGVRFRPQGRSVEHGLDCIGVAAMAAGVDGVRRDYDLRGSAPERVSEGFAELGFLRIKPEAAEAGDMLLVRAGPAQLHLVILTPDGYLHADAGLRRVVEVPGDVPWSVLSGWRHPDHDAMPHTKRGTIG